jgi:hypothetical protein
MTMVNAVMTKPGSVISEVWVWSPACQRENASERYVGQIQRSVTTKFNAVTSEDCDRLDLELWPTYWRISILYNPFTSKMEIIEIEIAIENTFKIFTSNLLS